MTADELDREYARQLTAMAAARVEHENPRHLRLMARETRRRRGAEMPAPEPGRRSGSGRTSTSTRSGYGARPNGRGRRWSR